ncbi:hypothetical protein FQN57_005327 [Myotisia sp. PD_48]|nr:hypothetical protein FQN57_005327 [Myotisia sp. PD_48]
MSDLIADWIGPYVQAAIQLTISRKRQSSDVYDALGDVFDDGSNFRVPVHVRRLAQLIKWRGGKAMLSDSSTSIRGMFTRDLTEYITRLQGTRPGTYPEAGIFRLSQFEITIGQTPMRNPEVYIYVQNMEVVPGLQGVGTLGNPCFILEYKDISKLAKQCYKGHGASGESCVTDKRSRIIDHSNSQAIESQVRDATPHEKCNNNHNHVGDRDTIHPNEDGNKTERPPKNLISRNNRAQLLDLLKRKDVSKEPSSLGSGDSGVPLCPSPVRGSATARSSPRQITRDRVAECQPLRASSSSSIPGSVAEFSTNVTDNVSGGTVRTPSALLRTNPPDARVDKTPVKAHTPDRLAHSRIAKVHPSITLVQGRVDTPPACQNSSESSFHGWKRIRLRDVIIPKDQQALIDSPDSWVPPHAGKRQPQRYVPIKLLQQWNELRKQPILPNDISPANSPRDDSEPENSDSSPSDPASDAEFSGWSPSPAPDARQVPPDSSPLRSEHMHTFQSYPNGNTEADSTRIDSSASNNPSQYDGQNLCHGVEIDPSIPHGLDEPEQNDCENHKLFTQDKNNDSSSHSEQTSKNSTLFQTPVETTLDNPQNPQTSSFHELDIHKDPCTDINDTTILVPATAYADSPKARKQPLYRSSVDRFALDLSTISSPSGAKMVNSQLNEELTRSTPYTNPKDSASLQMPTHVHNSQRIPSTFLDSPPGGSVTGGKRSSEIFLPTPSRGKMPRLTPSPLKANIDSFGPIEQPPVLLHTQQIYFRFRQTYTAYDGDIETFKRSCRNLQSLRERGHLHYSILWDDYVAREVNEYRDYIESCRRKNKLPVEYDSYFKKHAITAKLKRRNLTERNLQLVVDETQQEHKGSSLEGQHTIFDKESLEPYRFLPTTVQESSPSACPPVKRRTSPVQRQTIPDEIEESVLGSDVADSEPYQTHSRVSIELGTEWANDTATVPHKLTPKLGAIEEEIEVAAKSLLEQHEVSPPDEQMKSDSDSNGGFCTLQVTSKRNQLPRHGQTGLRKKSTSRDSKPRPRPSTPLHRKPASKRMGVQSAQPRLNMLRRSLDGQAQSKEKPTCLPTETMPNMAYKCFARSWAMLPYEFGSGRQWRSKNPLPIDKNGVVIVNALGNIIRDPQEGKMDGMGFKL